MEQLDVQRGTVAAGRLSGRVAVVTGAGGGIGSEVASALCQAGASVMLSDTSEESLSAVAERLSGNGATVAAFAGDSTKSDTAALAVSSCRATLGLPTLLANCIGYRAYTGLLDIDHSTIVRHLSVNTIAPLWWMQAIAGGLVEAGLPGSIVNLTSVMAHGVVPRNGAYCASKAAINALTRAAAIELADHGIRVNCVAPGPTATPMLADQMADPEWHAQILAGIPLGRLGQPVDLARAVVYLLSDDSDFVTGTSLFVDGGYTARRVG